MEPGRTSEVIARVATAAAEQGRYVGPAESSLAAQRTLRDPLGDQRPVLFPDDSVARSARNTDAAWRAAVGERRRLESQHASAFDPASEYVVFKCGIKRGCCSKWKDVEIRLPRREVMAFMVSLTPRMSPMYDGVGAENTALDAQVMEAAEEEHEEERREAYPHVHMIASPAGAATQSAPPRRARYPRPHGPDVRDTQHAQDE